MKKITITREDLEEALLNSFEFNISSIVLSDGLLLEGDYFDIVNQIVDELFLSNDEDFENGYEEDDEETDFDEFDDEEY